MDIHILEDKPDKLFVEIDKSPTIALNVLKEELWNDSHIKIVGTHRAHPLLAKERFIIETDGSPARKSITSATKKIQKDLEHANESLKGLR